MKINALKSEVKKADNRYSIYPLIESRVLQPDLHIKYKKNGYGGAVGTLEYTPDFPYNESEWVKVSESFRNFIENGMNVIIYDEYGYPSGTARGTVPESNSDFIAKGLYCYVHWKNIGSGIFYKGNIPEGRVYKALLIGNETGKIHDISSCVDKDGNLVITTPADDENYRLVFLMIRRLFEGTHATNNECEIRNYISMADKAATEKFIEVTHENYYKYAGKYFGKGIRAFFTDEPSLMSYALVPQLMPILPWMPWYPAEFEKRYGYPYENAICAVLLGKDKKSVKIRCDFWEFISDTVANGYFSTIKKWCGEHGIAFTGHLLSEENLQDHIVNYGSYYECLKEFDWPGIDMLGTTTEQLMSECVPFARIAASVADLYGCGESLSEFSDIKTYYGGVYVSIDEYYKSVNWHTVMGINNFVSLYAFRDGDGKEFPENNVCLLNEYTARINKFMRLGTRAAQTAILYPDTSMWAEYTANTNYHAISTEPGIALVNETFCKTSWELFHRQTEFDVVDNDVLLNCFVDGSACVFGTRKYENIIVPCCKVLRDEIAEKIEEFIKKGVKVVFIEKIPEVSRNNGEPADFGQTFKDAVKNGKAFFVPLKNITSAKDLSVRSDLRIENKGGMRFEKILSHTRLTDDGQRLVMIANMDKEIFGCNISVTGNYNKVYNFDPSTGDIEEIVSETKSDRTGVSVTIAGGKAKILLFDGEKNV